MLAQRVHQALESSKELKIVAMHYYDRSDAVYCKKKTRNINIYVCLCLAMCVLLSMDVYLMSYSENYYCVLIVPVLQPEFTNVQTRASVHYRRSLQTCRLDCLWCKERNLVYTTKFCNINFVNHSISVHVHVKLHPCSSSCLSRDLCRLAP